MKLDKLIELITPYLGCDGDIELSVFDSDDQCQRITEVVAVRIELAPDGHLLRIVLEAS